MTIPHGLLPEGLRDRLPPEAAAQTRIARALLDTIATHGYDLVSPPLVEFEEGLTGRLMEGRAKDTLRFVDPVSQRTLALRPDITIQIGRIASTRLASAPRPLRLAYGGPILKLRASQLAPAREIMQVGAELIGRDSVAAACEIVQVAVEALRATGVESVTVDLTLPDLVETLAGRVLAVEDIAKLKTLLDMKDAGALIAAGFSDWLPLMATTGPVTESIEKLRAFNHAGLLTSRIDGIAAVAEAIGDAARVTIDPTERHGFEYQSWFGFSLFAENISGEIGRGGSYVIVGPDGSEEPATGFSLYPDALLESPIPANAPTLFVPLGIPPVLAAQFRNEGYRTIAALDADCDAAKLGCSHRLTNGKAVLL
ncbi:ATP phosphoribosyltransferase regulatory subunit [Sphingomonas paeninsulae]|jgi:ATP phosphoribosyltransferase regulatory subunit|uniref:ATP phosphoribosyltransferase regulatory subunit n=1 Tax=Sphingomonas paeninsulae TaxID=2319844 RepID=A0A494TC46_SPHPE|nr:ATP phosphoribosyltransferase regulatory subunit [Sphingomonas paeninsulae]AYJ86730.1 ATP phosphoribosyltransferase regulatory subunit [Sphingomonas paeninsulae]